MNKDWIFGRSDHQFLGSEFDWLACDQAGNFGFFSTAGEGWIPEAVLADPEPFWDSLDIVKALPIVGEPDCVFSGLHVIEDWLQVAARGVHALDWNRMSKRYELVARPSGELDVHSARQLEKLAGGTSLPCSFSEEFPFRSANG